MTSRHFTSWNCACAWYYRAFGFPSVQWFSEWILRSVLFSIRFLLQKCYPPKVLPPTVPTFPHTQTNKGKIYKPFQFSCSPRTRPRHKTNQTASPSPAAPNGPQHPPRKPQRPHKGQIRPNVPKWYNFNTTLKRKRPLPAQRPQTAQNTPPGSPRGLKKARSAPVAQNGTFLIQL